MQNIDMKRAASTQKTGSICVQVQRDDAGEELEAAQKDADRALLRVFHAALKAEKVARALEVAAQLALPVSLQGALKLATHHRYKRPILPFHREVEPHTYRM